MHLLLVFALALVGSLLMVLAFEGRLDWARVIVNTAVALVIFAIIAAVRFVVN